MEKLTVLNDALRATGNNEINTLNDGSDEGRVAEGAFERAIRDLMSRHGWPFARFNGDLVMADEGLNLSETYVHCFELPDDMIHLKRVFVNGSPTNAYELAGNFVCLDVDSGVSVEGYTMPAHAIWHPQAAEILTMYVEAGCLAGLNEDFVEARNRKLEAENRLLEARPRIDRQNPAKNVYVSRVAAARRGSATGIAAERQQASVIPPAGSILLED